MCFSPHASLITALIEFGLLFYLIKRNKTTRHYPAFLFIFLLGFYQLTEFFLCSYRETILWASLGFITYTSLPAVIFHMLSELAGRKISKIVYLIPLGFSSLAFFPSFIKSTSCQFIHVRVESLVFGSNYILMFIYLFYYAVFPIFGLYIFIKYSQERVKRDIRAKLGLSFAPIAILLAQIYFVYLFIRNNEGYSIWIPISIIIILIGLILFLYGSFWYVKKESYYKIVVITTATSSLVALILYILLPLIRFDLSSIFCQFALLYAISTYFLVETLESNSKN